MTLITKNTQNNIPSSTQGLISSELLDLLNESTNKTNSLTKSLNLSDISSLLSLLSLVPTLSTIPTQYLTSQLHSQLHSLSTTSSTPSTHEYTNIAYAPLMHVLHNKNLTLQDKLTYIISDIYAAKTISCDPTSDREVTFTAQKLSEIIGYSERTALRVEQKLESLGYFHIERSKNKYNRNNVNIITPTIPDHIFKDLIHKNIRNNIDISEYNLSNIDYSKPQSSSKTSNNICKRSLLDKIGQYISFNMEFVRKVAFSTELTAFDKIQCIHLYVILHLISTKTNRFGYYGFLELDKLQKQLQIGRTSFFNLMDKLTRYGFIQREQFFVQDKTSEEEINRTSLSKVGFSKEQSNRYDKSIWKFTITLSQDLNELNLNKLNNSQIKQLILSNQEKQEVLHTKEIDLNNKESVQFKIQGKNLELDYANKATSSQTLEVTRDNKDLEIVDTTELKINNSINNPSNNIPKPSNISYNSSTDRKNITNSSNKTEGGSPPPDSMEVRHLTPIIKRNKIIRTDKEKKDKKENVGSSFSNFSISFAETSKKSLSIFYNFFNKKKIKSKSVTKSQKQQENSFVTDKQGLSTKKQVGNSSITNTTTNSNTSNNRTNITTKQQKRNKSYQSYEIYKEPKKLIDFYPIGNSDLKLLKDKSGKELSLCFINEILASLASKTDKSGDIKLFKHKGKFLKYFSLALKNELRDENKEIEQYFCKVEDDAIYRRTDFRQLQAKLINTLPKNLGYNLTKAMIYTNLDYVNKSYGISDIEDNVIGNILEPIIAIITLTEAIEISDYYKEKILNDIKATYGHHVSDVRFRVKGDGSRKCNSDKRCNTSYLENKADSYENCGRDVINGNLQNSDNEIAVIAPNNKEGIDTTISDVDIRQSLTQPFMQPIQVDNESSNQLCGEDNKPEDLENRFNSENIITAKQIIKDLGVKLTRSNNSTQSHLLNLQEQSRLELRAESREKQREVINLNKTIKDDTIWGDCLNNIADNNPNLKIDIKCLHYRFNVVMDENNKSIKLLAKAYSVQLRKYGLYEDDKLDNYQYMDKVRSEYLDLMIEYLEKYGYNISTIDTEYRDTIPDTLIGRIRKARIETQSNEGEDELFFKGYDAMIGEDNKSVTLIVPNEPKFVKENWGSGFAKACKKLGYELCDIK